MKHKCNCGRGAVFIRKYEGRAYCKVCFSRQIERKIKSTIRNDDLLRKNDRINAIGYNSAVIKFILKKYFQPWDLQVSNKGKNIKSEDADDLSLEIFKSAMQGNILQIKKTNSPLRHIPENELLLYSKINKIKLKKKKLNRFEKNLKKILDDLEQKRPGTKYQIQTFAERLDNE